MTALTTYPIDWFAEKIGKGPEWVRKNINDIPHRHIGQSYRFTEDDLAAYLEQTAVRPVRMQTTGPQRRRTP